MTTSTAREGLLAAILALMVDLITSYGVPEQQATRAVNSKIKGCLEKKSDSLLAYILKKW